jgi:hypothetical protein
MHVWLYPAGNAAGVGYAIDHATYPFKKASMAVNKEKINDEE